MQCHRIRMFAAFGANAWFQFWFVFIFGRFVFPFRSFGLWQMTQLMQSQMLFEFERFIAHIAFEISFGHMHGMMLPQNGQLWETLAALLARVFFLVLMGNANVSIQIGFVRVAFLAQLAFVRLESVVDFLMILHVVSLLKESIALGTFVSFFAVWLLMFIKFRIHFECFLACVTLKRSLATRTVRFGFAYQMLSFECRCGCGGRRYSRFIYILIHCFVTFFADIICWRQMLITGCIALIVETPEHFLGSHFGHFFIIRLPLISLR